MFAIFDWLALDVSMQCNVKTKKTKNKSRGKHGTGTIELDEIQWSHCGPNIGVVLVGSGRKYMIWQTWSPTDPILAGSANRTEPGMAFAKLPIGQAVWFGQS